MSVAILSLGTELTRGEVQNGNATWLAERLTQIGHQVTEIATVDDDDERIEAALRRLGESSEIVVCTGGLGPTTDDRTSACVARVLAVPLIVDRAAWAVLEAALRRRGRQLGPDNEKQAYVPRGAVILDNPVGSAPGFHVTVGRAASFFLPGVPAEMQAMFECEVAPRLPRAHESWIVLHLRTAGMPESEIGQRLASIEQKYDVTLGYRASSGGVAIKVLARAKAQDEPGARRRAEAAWAEVNELLAPAVYSTSSAPLEQVLGGLLQARGLSIGLAESCTGGGASELLTRIPGSSAYFKGAIVAYDNSVKVSVLGVPQALLGQVGAVSREVAEAMAEGARHVLAADVGVGITGLAGPDGGSETKPVGLVHWAVAYRNRVDAFQARFSGPRTEVQKRAAMAALFSAWKTVRHDEAD